MNKKINFILFPIIILAVVLLISFYPKKAETTPSPKPTEVSPITAEAITLNMGGVVWVDSRDLSNLDIYAYDFTKKEIAKITSYLGTDSAPRIYRDKIVWGRINSNYRQDIYLYNLSTKQETQITNNDVINYYDSTNPDIYNNKIIWTNSNYALGRNESMVYDLRTNGEEIISHESKTTSNISGNRISLFSLFNRPSKVFVYDLISGETEIDAGVSELREDMWPQVYGNWIAWIRCQPECMAINESRNIFAHNISTNQRIQITNTNNADKLNPSIYGNKVVWTEIRDGKSNVYMYNLATKQEFKLSKIPGSYGKSVINGHKVAWIYYSFNRYCIQVYDLTTGLLTQITPNYEHYISNIDLYSPIILPYF